MYLRGKDGYIIPLSQVRWDSPTISRWKDIVPGSVVNVNGAETNGRTAAIFTLPSCRSITQDAANSDMEPGALRILVGGQADLPGLRVTFQRGPDSREGFLEI